MTRKDVKAPEDCRNLPEVRRGIDSLDREIVSLIGRRAHYVEAAARFKSSESTVQAPERRRAMLDERRRWAEEENLDPDAIEDFYGALISYFVNRELQSWKSGG